MRFEAEELQQTPVVEEAKIRADAVGADPEWFASVTCDLPCTTKFWSCP